MRNVIVCGCTRNSEPYLEANLLALYKVRPCFDQFRILVYENDSTDRTRAVLARFRAMHADFYFMQENGVDRLLKSRTERIAHGRNRLIRYVSAHRDVFDYMIMVDLDVAVPFLAVQLGRIFEMQQDWDVLTANCFGRYYDIWALRIGKNNWDPQLHGKIWAQSIDSDCWQQPQAIKTVANAQRVIPPGSPLIPVDSAFGGLAIYKVGVLQGCSYSRSSQTCEHVAFHEQLRRKNGARIFICPALQVQCQTEHLI